MSINSFRRKAGHSNGKEAESFPDINAKTESWKVSSVIAILHNEIFFLFYFCSNIFFTFILLAESLKTLPPVCLSSW